MEEQIKEEVVEEVQEEVVSSARLSSLVIDLHKVLEEARNVISRYQQKSNSIDEREKKVLARELSITAIEKDLITREDACQKVEDVVSMQKNAQALLDSANLRINAAVEAEKLLSQHTSEQGQIIANDRILAKTEANNVLKQRQDIENEVSRRVDDFLTKNGFKKG